MDQQTLAANGFTAAPAWSLLLGQIGVWCVLGAVVLFVMAALASGLGRLKLGRWSFAIGCMGLLGAMAALATLFLKDRFEYEYIGEHSWHNLAPWYKFAAVWAGQQGSFLLWACTSAVFGLLAIWKSGPLQRWFTVVYSLFLGSLAGILAYETPFRLIPDGLINGIHWVPPDGSGLNPSLQNYWVVIHPPTIFTGFGSLTVLFAFAVSAMIGGDARAWAARVRPWALVSLAILGLGLVMGGLWAYETLGWGGFWAWDPVENVSFVPWIFCAAFIHGLIVQTTRGRWHGTNFLLGGLPFLAFVYGTFLTRSGFLSKFSVHSFAEMNRSALMILMISGGAFLAGFFVLWATRGRALAEQVDVPIKNEGFNREKAYESGVILLTGLATAIAIGMSVPFFIGLGGGNGKVVEEPLYHSVVVWFFVPIMLLMGAGPFLAWRRMSAREFWNRLTNVLAITLGLVGILMFALKLSDWGLHSHALDPIAMPFGFKVPRVPWTLFLAAITCFTAVANLWRLVELFRRSKTGVGGFLAHMGVAVALGGLILSRGLEQKAQVLVSQVSPGAGLGYAISYDGLTSNPLTDRENKALFTVIDGKREFTARPGFYYVDGQDGPQGFTWPHIQHWPSHDVYLALSPPVTSLWDKPVQFRVGETKATQVGDGTSPLDIVAVTYLGFTRHGAPGKAGTTFGAKLKIVEGGREYTVEPQFGVSTGAVPVPATPNYNAAMMGMNAADKSVTIDLLLVHPIFPIEIFYKPMVILVWIGTGILTFGGLLSAFYRRNRRVPPEAQPATVSHVEEVEDALVPTA